MTTTVDIGTMSVRTPNIRGGRPCIAGTGVTVQRIARSYKMGATPEEIVAELPHLTLAQVHAALAYYLANQAEIEEDLASEDALYEELARRGPVDHRSALMSTIRLRLPDSLHAKVRELAEKEHVPIHQTITLAVAEKVSALMTEEYLGERARCGDREKF